MKVEEIMSADVVVAKETTSYKKLWEAILKKNIHALPIVDSKKKLIGIISEEDLLKPLYPNYQHFIEDLTSAREFEEMERTIQDIVDLVAKHIMSRRVIFTRPDTPIMRALSRMLIRNVRQLPVLSKDDVLIGMVSKGDIFDALFRRDEKDTIKKSKLKKKINKKT